ncbi:MAG: HupE/UreJ family protein [Marinilabiliales bacterium]|nr:HupE/UreJ family protein [Marinilabiliales bacterium]
MDKKVIRSVILAIFLGLIPSAAYAHDGSNVPFGGFLSGLVHPVLGFDHLLAMLSVGILSAQIGGRAIWTVPATFVSVMALGGALGLIDIGLTSIELGIAASLVLLGLIIAAEQEAAHFACHGWRGFLRHLPRLCARRRKCRPRRSQSSMRLASWPAPP